ncbi:LytTR family DNA-binding domain-containing protein [Hymenobacter sp. YC55]|uniref:LytR/AlgR family response regulator transcription factor n=1 Tax=Hymenobacter sp. YC55 TaxID=3034019 RepID=UPI0023F997D7|nr:LytTR family DNA-binding domain-containing protein [Hymenobacter sp. YC55]MDF7813838.1 LytTR family DNA-binding domain-containing protein [Hymenobacter sp. YC55]
MKLTCLILDDEPLARELLVEFIKKVPLLHVQATCASALEAMEVLRTSSIDVLFLDVQMPDLSGLELLRLLPRKPLVVLTTAYSRYALESYEFDTVDYLLKPFTLERFLRAVEKVRARAQLAEPEATSARGSGSPFLFVKDGVKLVKVRWADILYVEGLRDYVAIHTRERKIVSLQRLKVLEQQLPSEQFVRIHQSFIVSLEGIQAIHKDKVQVGERFLPVSDSYRKSFKEFIDRNFLQTD